MPGHRRHLMLAGEALGSAGQRRGNGKPPLLATSQEAGLKVPVPRTLSRLQQRKERASTSPHDDDIISCLNCRRVCHERQARHRTYFITILSSESQVGNQFES